MSRTFERMARNGSKGERSADAVDSVIDEVLRLRKRLDALEAKQPADAGVSGICATSGRWRDRALRAERERDEARAANDYLREHRDRSEHARFDYQQQADAAHEALAKYGRHTVDCRSCPCTCGLQDALTASRTEVADA